jgi:hypothetical protein
MVDQSLISSALALPYTIPGLTEREAGYLTKLVQRLGSKQIRNTIRSKYYDAKQTVRHLGIAIPPHLQSIETVIGWPAKAVDDLEQRIDFDGFVIPGATWSDFGLDVIWSENQLALEASQAHASALKYAVSFVAVLAGDKAAGEPEVIVRPLSAMSSTAIWDPLRRRVEAALSVTAADGHGVREFILYTDDRIITVSRDYSGWMVDARAHNLKRAPVAVLPFKPNLESPYGKSRISRAVMSITDRAVRTLLRMEVSAEFYSAPQRYVLGAKESAFQDADGNLRTGWEAIIGKLLVAEADPDGDKLPQVGQFPQMTMEPHMGMVRSDAAMFSGETGIPVDTLGIIHDNPSSAQGVMARYQPLIKTAERAQVPFGIGWVDAAKLAVQVRDGLSEPPDALRLMQASFRPAHLTTIGEASDAMLKQITAIPWIGDSTVALERLGYTQTEIERLLADKQRGQVTSLVGALRQNAAAAVQDPQVAELAARRAVES